MTTPMPMATSDLKLGEIRIDRRFNGPELSANGGYACGRVAAFVDGPAEVTLRMPPLLDRRLSVHAAGDGEVRVLDGEDLVAEARPVAALEVEPPLRPGLAEAKVARVFHPGIGVRHPLSDCFVCGPERTDGLAVSPGPLGRGGMGAAPFEPDETVADGQGVVPPEIVWAALDCPSYPIAMWEAGRIALLGRLAAELHREVRAGERLVALGWPLGSEGRKHFSASAILDPDGSLVARARATWIELRAA